MSLYLDDEGDRLVAKMRADDPHGRSSNNELERVAMIDMLRRHTTKLDDETCGLDVFRTRLKDIIESILDIIT